VDKPWESVLVEGHEFARVFSKRGKSFQQMTSSKFAGNVVRFLPARLLEGFPSLTKNPCKFIFFHQILPPILILPPTPIPRALLAARPLTCLLQ
jgi:hypothetical protein